jgi:RNA polymerase sigma-70 factor (ECF subfamily)
MDKFKDGTNLRVWLLTISKNTALDHLRKEKRSQIKPVDLADVPEPVESRVGPSAELMKKEEGTRVREALEELPERERDVVSLRIFETLTWDAISEVLGIPEATARARMNRALQRLRTAMG